MTDPLARLAAETKRAEEAEAEAERVAKAAALISVEKEKAEDALAAAEQERDALKARACVECALAYTECPRTIQLLDGGGPMDVDHCSEWQPREAAE